jgi:hypothetical protein
MVKIAIVAKVDHPPLDLLRAIAPHSDSGLAELSGRFRGGEVVVVRPVTGSEWEESHADLRAVVRELQSRGIPFQLWEAVDDQEPPNEGRQITSEVMENILQAHADEHAALRRERQ